MKLDPADIHKAMWAEVSPDGKLLWTSSGGDLLAYRTADITRGQRRARRTRRSTRCGGSTGAVPPTGITGATFVDGRLLVAGAGRQDVPGLVDRPRHRRARARDRAHDRRRVGGARHHGGQGRTLGWLIQPFNPEENPPTYSPDHATLVSFARPAGAVSPGPPAPPAAGSGAGLSPALRFFHRKRRTVLRRGFLGRRAVPRGLQRATLTVKRGRQLLARTSKRVRPGPIAKVRVKLTKRGRPRAARATTGGCKLTLRAALRLPSGASTKRKATAKLR